MLANHFILHAPGVAISTSPLPATLRPLYPNIIVSSPKPAHGLAHGPPTAMISNTHQASDPHFLRGALFHFQNAPEPGCKRPPPQHLYSTFCFYPLSVWLRCPLHPIKVFLARCYPITPSCTLKWLHYQLHHFRIHLCSMIRNTQQASAPHFLQGAPFSPQKRT